jgi:toxin ParE1/3/4
MRIVISDKAKADLFEIYHYIRERSPNAADAFVRRIDANIANLARFPFIGRERPALSPGLRCLVIGLHLLFYMINADEITIVRVIDARMDVDEEFRR